MTDNNTLNGQAGKNQTEEKKFIVVFEGKIKENTSLPEVKQKIANLFNVDPAGVESIFAETPRILKSNLSLETAYKYKTAFEQTGALCMIEEMEKPPPPKEETIPQPESGPLPPEPTPPAPEIETLPPLEPTPPPKETPFSPKFIPPTEEPGPPSELMPEPPTPLEPTPGTPSEPEPGPPLELMPEPPSPRKPISLLKPTPFTPEPPPPIDPSLPEEIPAAAPTSPLAKSPPIPEETPLKPEAPTLPGAIPPIHEGAPKVTPHVKIPEIKRESPFKRLLPLIVILGILILVVFLIFKPGKSGEEIETGIPATQEEQKSNELDPPKAEKIDFSKVETFNDPNGNYSLSLPENYTKTDESSFERSKINFTYPDKTSISITAHSIQEEWNAEKEMKKKVTEIESGRAGTLSLYKIVNNKVVNLADAEGYKLLLERTGLMQSYYFLVNPAKTAVSITLITRGRDRRSTHDTFEKTIEESLEIY